MTARNVLIITLVLIGALMLSARAQMEMTAPAFKPYSGLAHGDKAVLQKLGVDTKIRQVQAKLRHMENPPRFDVAVATLSLHQGGKRPDYIVRYCGGLESGCEMAVYTAEKNGAYALSLDLHKLMGMVLPGTSTKGYLDLVFSGGELKQYIWKWDGQKYN